MLDKTTIVLPSARAIRHEQLNLQEHNTFLPHYITMGDFVNKLCIIEGYATMDDDSRVLLLLEASNFDAFSVLQIEQNFFTFTKNSSYIFKFFQDLSAELCDIDTLDLADTYAEYEEHILILKELYRRYEILCNEKKLLDRIFLAKLYIFNEEYAKTHKKIELQVDGHLTNFEFELLEKVALYAQVKINFTTTQYNVKMQAKFKEFGLSLDIGYKYTLDFNSKSIVSCENTEINHNIVCESFSEDVLQIAFIKQKLYEFVKKGYKAENIAVILPNEQRAEMLRNFDDKSNLNFAMGEPYVKSMIYIKLNATIQAIEYKSQENYHRLERIGDELYLPLLALLQNDAADLVEFLESVKTFISSKRELKVFEEELYKYSHLLHSLTEMSKKSLMSIFMSRLAARSLDDVRGGKVTVMGVLETRSVTFDGVIIIDFNDKHVPKRSDKDMFLNTQIRENAKLPTMSDRENLQKHYYEVLMQNAQEVAIAYVDSSESNESRFLKQLGIKVTKHYNEEDYAALLFTAKEEVQVREETIVEEYSFKDIKLSATRLKTFLTCKRKYYYNYVAHIKAHVIPKDMPQEYEIGNSVHLALKELYTKQTSYDDVALLAKDLHKELDKQKGDSELESYLIAMQKKRMESFCENEVERFSQGWSVLYCEESMSIKFAGMTLVGQIDRIDKRENEIAVLDYKTGSYTLYTKNSFTDAKDFQLEFYYLLAGGLGNVSCGFYDLKASKIIPESFLEEKLAILESNIKDLLTIEEVNFEKCEDTKPCQFCEYSLMCGR